MCLPIFAGVGAALGAAAGTTTAAVVGTTAVAATAAGIGLSAYSAIEAGQTNKEIASYNAKMKQRAADDALQLGAEQAAEQRQRTRIIQSSQATGMAASGVNIGTGTPLQILTETAGVGELDALKIVNNAQRQAYGYNAEAELDLFQGRRAERSGYLNAGASLLSGATNAYFGFRKAA